LFPQTTGATTDTITSIAGIGTKEAEGPEDLEATSAPMIITREMILPITNHP